MFEINPDSLVTKTDKLLYNIWQNLEKLNAEELPEEVTEQASKGFACKHCKQMHATKPELMSCARKSKKAS